MPSAPWRWTKTQVADEADVGVEVDAAAVGGLGGQPAQRLELAVEGTVLAVEPVVLAHDVGRRVDEDHAGVAVDEHLRRPRAPPPRRPARRPTTVGISNDLARMDACEVTPPVISTMPFRCSWSIRPRSERVISSATSTLSRSSVRSGSSTPSRLRSRRRPTSFTSAARSLRYSSRIAAKRVEVLVDHALERASRRRARP